jgi:hypothetical protein
MGRVRIIVLRLGLGSALGCQQRTDCNLTLQ